MQAPLFSADLPDARLAATFGAAAGRGLLRYKLMVAPSGKYQSVPAWVDTERNLRRWRDALEHHGKYNLWDGEHSGIVPGASHALSDDDRDVLRRYLLEESWVFSGVLRLEEGQLQLQLDVMSLVNGSVKSYLSTTVKVQGGEGQHLSFIGSSYICDLGYPGTASEGTRSSRKAFFVSRLLAT
ncbi:hypothetical protein PG994_013732 [Apiospora phragmitis]|uniref:Uncharacterized protein n=1 Tax=Apiospora phragmitis TaxID=2905665 RepID=A0ABR1TBT3_9PEZI